MDLPVRRHLRWSGGLYLSQRLRQPPPAASGRRQAAYEPTHER